jgi:hypothetical protein
MCRMETERKIEIKRKRGWEKNSGKKKRDRNN